MQQTFEKWLENNNKSARHASTLKTISNDLKKVHYAKYDIFTITTLQEAQRVHITEYPDTCVVSVRTV